MGIEFKLTDRELPVSPAFIHFLAQRLGGHASTHEIWADQLSEGLMRPEGDMHQEATKSAAAVMDTAAGRERVARAYRLLCALLVGDMAQLSALRSPFYFVTVIGIPRTGGSYLTAELYRALGMVPDHVPQALAHDSFPTIGPFELQRGNNGWILNLKTMAEYLTMVELFFEGRKPNFGKIVVPKKLTQASYAGGFLHCVLGEEAEYILTLRHPVAACVSTYEKSGGLPVNGCFTVRSNIEAWCRRDLQSSGVSLDEINTMDYFDVYLRYWELYHLSLATTGLSASPNLRVVVFGKTTLQSLAQSYHDRYRSGLHVTELQVSARSRQSHPQWMERAQPAIARIAAIWKTIGIPFPVDEIDTCW